MSSQVSVGFEGFQFSRVFFILMTLFFWLIQSCGKEVCSQHNIFLALRQCYYRYFGGSGTACFINYEYEAEYEYDFRISNQ